MNHKWTSRKGFDYRIATADISVIIINFAPGRKPPEPNNKEWYARVVQGNEKCLYPNTPLDTLPGTKRRVIQFIRDFYVNRAAESLQRAREFEADILEEAMLAEDANT